MIVTHCALCLSCEGRFRDELQTAYDAALKSAIPQIDNLIEKNMCVFPFAVVGACATLFDRIGRRALVVALCGDSVANPSPVGVCWQSKKAVNPLFPLLLRSILESPSVRAATLSSSIGSSALISDTIRVRLVMLETEKQGHENYV